MLTPAIKSYTDNLYNESQNSACHYFLYIYANRFCSVIANKAQQQVLKLTIYEFNVNVNLFELSYDELKTCKVITDEALLPFKSRAVIICNNSQAFVPESLLNISDPDLYYELNHIKLQNSQVLYCKMHYNHIACLFNVSNELLKFIRFNMPMVDIYHGSLLFVKALDEQAFEAANKKLHINLHNNYIEIACVNKGLKFYNTFLFDSETDIVYYILAVSESLGLEDNVEVFLYGKHALSDVLVTLLKKYVSKVVFGIKYKNCTYPVSFNQFSEHLHFIESASLLCE